MDKVYLGLLLPFLGTLLGSSMVFLLRGSMGVGLKKLLLGFASGVMVAASVWSLLIPSIEMSAELGVVSWLPAAVGFLLGMAFLFLLDTIIPHIHTESQEPEGIKSSLKRSTMLALAVTLHNIPEGMAVGVVLAGAMEQVSGISIAGALALTVGMAVQNFPEGAIVSMPLRSEGLSKLKAFSIGALSGIVEPVFALLTMLLISFVTPVLPYLLAFAAGSMIYVVVEELIPESQAGNHSNIGTIGVAIGFILMMVLDVALAA